MPSLSPETTVTVNPDGSVRVTPPTLFDFAQPCDGAIWGILQFAGDRRDIVRLDPETYEIKTVVGGLPILPNPVAPVTVHGSIWLVSWDKSSVTQYDVETGELIREIEVGRNPIEPVVAYGDVWTINHNGDSLTRIDVETGEATTIDLPDSHPLWITVVDEDLMLAGGPSSMRYVVDPQRMEVIGSYTPSECLGAQAAIGGDLWAQLCDQEVIAMVDPLSGEVLDSFDSPAIPAMPLMVDGNIWLPAAAEEGPGAFALVGLDAQTREVVGAYEQRAEIREGSSFAAFDSWWRWGWEGLLRVPADTLRGATQPD